MKNSIYISNDQIQIVSYETKKGRVIIKNYLSDRLPDKTIFNGSITDEDALSDRILKLATMNKNYFKNASLTIDSSAVLAKKITVPKLTPAQAAKVAKEEMSSFGGFEQLLIDYSFITGKDSQYMLACGLDKPILDKYISIFKNAKIELASINLGLDLIVNFVRQRPELCSGSIAICLLDDVSLLSLIFENGNFMFSTRARIMGDNAEEFSHRLLESVQSLVQFNKSVSKCYFLGVPRQLLEIINRLKSHNLEAELVRLDLPGMCEGGNLVRNESHFSILGAFAQPSNINLLNAYRSTVRQANAKPSLIKPVYLAALAVVVALGGLYGWLWYETDKNEKAMDELQYFLQDFENVEKQNKMNEIQRNIDALLKIDSQFAEGQRQIDDHTYISSETINWLYSKTSDKIQIDNLSFDADKKTLDVTYTCPSELDSGNYVTEIKEYKQFKGIMYTGYTSSGGKYTFKITISLNSPAEEGAAQ